MQGDEPLINPSDKKIYKNSKKNPHIVLNGMTKIKSKDDFFNYNIH